MLELKKIKWMIKKEFIVLKRHPSRLVSILAFPIIMILLFGYGMGGDLTNLPVVVVAQDDGVLTNATLEAVKSTDTFHVEDITTDVNTAKEKVDSGEVKAAIILPKEFDNFTTDQSKAATLYLDSSDQMASQVIIPVAQQLFAKVSAMAGEYSTAMGSSAGTMTTSITTENAIVEPSISNSIEDVQESITLHINKIFGEIKYIDFLVPAVLGMTVMMSCMMGMGSSVAGERETGELARLFMTPTSVATVLAGKIAGKLSVEFMRTLVLLFAAIVLFGVAIKGGIINTIIVLFIGALCFVGFGIMLSSRASTQEDYTQLVMPFCMPMMFVSGVFYPIETMPWIFQKIAYIFPLTYLNDAMRGVMIKGLGLGDIWLDLLVLIGFTLVFFIVGVKRFNRDV
ncbi:MAG: ABC transporter permease [Methanobrevibacter woesei]|nr:ABC transporter permease [Methanobrevibacter woesei]